MFQLPLTYPDPVNMSVSIEENVELPETVSDPLIIAPFDAVTDAKCAELPLTIIFFQVDNYYSIYFNLYLNFYKYVLQTKLRLIRIEIL